MPVHPTSEQQMLEPNDQMSPHTRRYFRGLVEICGKYDILPDSYIIPESKIQKLGDCPTSSDSFSEVWPGWYGENKLVTIKSVQYRKSDDIRETKYVGTLTYSPHQD